MKVLQQSHGETQSKEVKTLPSHLMNFQWSREQKWNRVPVSTVNIRTVRRIQIVILLEDENNEGFLQKTCWYSRAQSGSFGDLITKFLVKKVNRGTIIDMPWWYKTWQHSGYNLTHLKQKLLRRPRRA